MKKFKFLLTGLLFISVISCNKSEQKPLDDPSYYDEDGNCEQSRGTCCDTDGRILVIPNETYTYTYSNNTVNVTDPNYKIIWEVLEGSIVLISGQNSSEAKFKFGSEFTTGKIRATGKVTNGCCECSNTIYVSKL
jgi:hypothetical protein